MDDVIVVPADIIGWLEQFGDLNPLKLSKRWPEVLLNLTCFLHVKTVIALRVFERSRHAVDLFCKVSQLLAASRFRNDAQVSRCDVLQRRNKTLYRFRYKLAKYDAGYQSGNCPQSQYADRLREQ